MRAYVEAKSRKSKSDSLRAVATLPPDGRPGRCKVPFPLADRTGYQSRPEASDIDGQIARAPIKEVPVHGLHAIQESVDRNLVRAYVAKDGTVATGTTHTEHGGLVDLPIVVRSQGVNYLHDGHHRATAEKLRGALTIRARFVDLDSANASSQT